MFRLITIEREYGCGAADIAAQLADHLGWKLWDQLLTEEIARLANVDRSAVRRCDERMDSPCTGSRGRSGAAVTNAIPRRWAARCSTPTA